MVATGEHELAIGNQLLDVDKHARERSGERVSPSSAQPVSRLFRRLFTVRGGAFFGLLPLGRDDFRIGVEKLHLERDANQLVPTKSQRIHRQNLLPLHEKSRLAFCEAAASGSLCRERLRP